MYQDLFKFIVTIITNDNGAYAKSSVINLSIEDISAPLSPNQQRKALQGIDRVHNMLE